MSTPLPHEPWVSNYRLNPAVRPKLYEVKLHPDLKTGLFTCEERILLDISAPTDCIYLHIDRLNISKSVVMQHGESVPVKRAFAYPKHQYWVVELERPLAVGLSSVEFVAHGSLRKQDIVGFYESRYKSKSGEIRNIATSKFEPTYARQAFPCFDEPSMKSKFLVKLVKPKEKYIALSNMNVKTITDDSPGVGQSTVEFETTVPMSTYLVCFIVCDFDHLPSRNASQGFPLTVYAREGQLEHMAFALDTAVGAIDFYVEYFGIQYPLPKLDLIAIPDFVSGAMEHWGLVTFREAAVIFKEGSSSVVNKKRVAMTTSHELAHMWFGDLVTMGWWNDLWLNEGFASFMQYKALARVIPSWEVDTMFLTDMLHNTLTLDQTLSSHPIVQKVSNPDQITEIFDVISYQKGSSVIRMLENMMGEESFARGVGSYLTEFKFRNAETQDLWNHLQKFATNMSVTNVMDTYTRQMGFPLITVNRKGDSLTFRQSRYLSNNNSQFNASDSPYGYTWDVYITVHTHPNQTQSVWLYRNMTEAVLTLPANTAWVKINKNQVGYYRVMYDEAMWKALVDQLMADPKVFDARDRSNLIDDIFNLAESERTPYSTAFNLVKYMSQEDHFVPWTVVFSKLSKIEDKLLSTDGHADFLKYVRCLIKGKLSDETWNMQNETFLAVNYKLVLNDLGCNFGVPSCLSKAQELLNTWFKSGEKPLGDLRGLVYRYGMEQVGEAEWSTMWSKYQEESNPQEQMKIMNGLASVKDTKLLEKFLEMAKDEKNIRSQDYFSVIAMVGNNPTGLPLAWDFIRTNWDYLVGRFGLNSRVFGRIVPTVCGKFTTEERLQEVKDFFAKYPEAGAGAAGRKQALESIQNNIKWVQKHGAPLTQWLKNNTCNDDV